MIRYHARWVLPISSPPIRDGTVVELAGRIVYVGPRHDAPDAPDDADRDLGNCALIPGLVNAHTHLELTVFRGLLEDLSFREWIARLQGTKGGLDDAERSSTALVSGSPRVCAPDHHLRRHVRFGAW